MVVAGTGLDEDVIGRRFGADEGVMGRVLRSGEATAFSDARELPFLPFGSWDMREREWAGACAPIEWDGAVRGALVVSTGAPAERCEPLGLKAFGAIAEVAGAALGHADHRERSDETVRARVETLSAALRLRDRATGDHLQEVVGLTVEVGERLGLEPAEIIELEFAAYLHDIGKLAVPDWLLQRPGPLTSGEWVTMRRHPELGADMLADLPGLEAVAIVVRFHHERYDGWGYPDGLEGDCIPLASRIVAVCDAYDAIIADRPYRRGRSHEAALEELRVHAGTQFDSDVVGAFLQGAGQRALQCS